MLFERLSQLSNTAAGRLRVKSALNPALWLCAIVTPLCIWGATLFPENGVLQSLLAIVGIVPVLVACGVFIYFAIKKPEKLQSEDYQIRHETLQIISEKGGAIAVEPASLEAIAAATIRQIEARSERPSI